MKTRLEKRQRAQGYRRVNGKPHGFNWVDYWVVEVVFESKEEAEEFMATVNKSPPHLPGCMK